MAEPNPNSTIDPNSGYSSSTKTFHSLRPPIPLPPLTTPLSVSQFSLSLLHKSSSSLSQTTAFIDSTTGKRTSFQDFISKSQTLASFLQKSIKLNKGDTAYILVPSSAEIPIIYFALLSLGVIVSPANPISSEDEISRQIDLTNPVIAFATSATVHKVPHLKHRAILVDSDEFRSLIETRRDSTETDDRVVVDQSDTAAILYSSGTTGRVKGVMLTHRNFIALLAGLYEIRYVRDAKQQQVSLFTVPMFHVFGFLMCVRAVALAETVVLMEKFDFVGMLKAVQEYRVTYMPVAPPIVVAMAKLEIVGNYDLSSLEVLACGGAPLGKEVTQKLIARLPHVYVTQGYGLTESGGAASKMVGPDESEHVGSTGRLYENMEGKIVDPETGEALPPGQRGELWLRGPTVMKGYVGDDEATASTLDPDGWLKTGDLCYFDNEGYLFIVDRLKELIKYKAFQVPPAELEHLLQSHPAIADAAVIPYPDEEAGQIPMAYIVRKPGSNLNEAQVKDFIAKQVAPYKKIRRVAFVNAIPKSPAGKILRRELIDIALSNRSSKL